MSKQYELEIAHHDTFETFAEALTFLNTYQRHMIGQLICLPYKRSESDPDAVQDPIACILAIGTRDFRDVQAGEPNYGRSFYEIIPTMSMFTTATTSDDKPRTMFTFNNTRVTVLDDNREDDVNITEVVSDPFAWNEHSK